MTRSIVRFDPFSGLEALRRDLFDDGLLRGLRGVSLPTTDVYTEDDKALIVEAHLPNFEEKDITVNVDGGQLIIQADRHEKEEDKKKNYVVRESSSSFYRSIALPDQADDAGITAAFENGLLKVTVPLTQAATPRKIAITGA
ncbi:Hsp20/alpha crystallin family protein [Microbacterium sp. X-17]|uniref:Hsp20/alpha crystallin family protein n=1 Tax=Microbacterium sp. X-17 TaxID=3144404 RepID=UPI0031F4829D